MQDTTVTNSFTLDPIRRNAIQRIGLRQRIWCERTFGRFPMGQRSIVNFTEFYSHVRPTLNMAVPWFSSI